MPPIEEPEAPEVEDTPPEEVEAPEEGQASAGEEPDYWSDSFDPRTLTDEQLEDWREEVRSGHLRHADYTRKTQELAEQRRSPDRLAQTFAQLSAEDQRKVLEQTGYQFDEEPDEPDEEDIDFRDPRVDQLLQEREQDKLRQRQEQAWQAQIDSINTQLSTLQKDLGRALDQDEINEIGDLAQSPKCLDSEGMPDVRAAFERLSARDKRIRKAAFGPKRGAPSAPAGRSGSEKVDTTDPQERIRLMAEIMEAESAET